MAFKLSCDSHYRGKTAVAIQGYNFLAGIAYPITVIIGCDNVTCLEENVENRARLHAAFSNPDGHPQRTRHSSRATGDVLLLHLPQ
jgi:hypothetical protein